MTGADQRVAVTVLVPIRNEEPHIREVLEAMRAQRFDEGVEFLLLDGGSTDSTITELTAVVGSDRRFRLVQLAGSTRAERLNLGLRQARGGFVARMDAHTLFPPDYLAVGVARLRQGDVASVSGPAIAVGRGTWSRRVALALRSRLGTGDAQFRHLSPNEIELASGYCGIWPRSLLIAHGGWNELAFTEDIELAARIAQRGGRIVCLPAMAAQYFPRETLSGLASQYGRYGYHRVRTARRHPQMARPSHVLPPALVVATLSAVAGQGRAAPAARRALTLYAAALVVESVRAGRGESAGDRLGLPAVFATMHLAWGSGFLAGCLRHGPPWAARRHHPRHGRAAAQPPPAAAGPATRPPGRIPPAAAAPPRGPGTGPPRPGGSAAPPGRGSTPRPGRSRAGGATAASRPIP